MQWVKLSERKPELKQWVVVKVYTRYGDLDFASSGCLTYDDDFVYEKIDNGEIKPEPGVPFTVDNVPIIFDVDCQFCEADTKYSESEFNLIEWLDEEE